MIPYRSLWKIRGFTLSANKSTIYIFGLYHADAAAMPKTAKLFMNGRSQAVRLPAEFRFEGSEVYIEKHGDTVVLRPKRESLVDRLESFYVRHEPLPEDFLANRQDEPPQDRDWFHDQDP